MRLLLVFGVVVVPVAVILAGFLYLPVKNFYPSEEITSLTFRIDEDESFHSISKRLKQNNLIVSDYLFAQVARFKNFDKEIKYGEFLLINSMSLMDVLKKITSNDYLKYNIYVKNCITSWEVKKLLQQKDFLIDDLFNDVLKEGVYAPDTYRVGYNIRSSKLLELMRARQNKILRSEWTQRDLKSPIKSQSELLILASIIEKEAATLSEMPKVASVFINRLAKGMRLQSDPTVTYGIDLGDITKRRKIKKSDLNFFTRHNTYRISGLPVSPICNPSQNAIKAAANPADTNLLYFVMSKSGEHVFAKTFDEHKENVSKWRKFKKEN